MKISDIQRMPSTKTNRELENILGPRFEGCSGVHESVYRSWQILEKLKELLDRGVDPLTLRELIEVMETRP